MIFDIIKEAFIDTIKLLPFLYLAYLFIEYIEHRHSEKLSNALKRLGPFGPFGGSLLGCIPQCGFSAAASNLYAGRMITFGTLIAVYASTSDEAVPIVIADPAHAGEVWKLVGVKFLVGAAAGLAADAVIRILRKKYPKDEEPEFEELCADCGCDHRHFAVSALIHTLKIALFILIVNLILGAAFSFAGKEAVERIMLSGSPLQPFAAALFGAIPNCAASVMITELYLSGALTFGSCVSGLCTGAGAGLLVLFRANRNIKENLVIFGTLYAFAIAAGIIINTFF